MGSIPNMFARLVKFFILMARFDSMGILSRIKLYQSSTELTTASSTCSLMLQSTSLLHFSRVPWSRFKHLGYNWYYSKLGRCNRLFPECLAYRLFNNCKTYLRMYSSCTRYSGSDATKCLCFRMNSTQWFTKTRATSANLASSSAWSKELSRAYEIFSRIGWNSR